MPLHPASPTAHVSRLLHRPMQTADIAGAIGLLPAHVAFDAAERDAIAGLWPRLLADHQPAVQTGVMEDLARPPGQRLVGWGVSILLSLAQARSLDLYDRPRAHVARRVYQRLLSGELVPLDDRGLGRCNGAGELVALVLHFTLPHIDVADPQVHKIVACAQESFRCHHSGWQWHGVFLESSVAFHEVHRASGFERRPFADEGGAVDTADPRYPVFMGLTREEARQQLPGTTLRNAFEHEPPRFRFSAPQRRLLWLALFDEADQALMPELGVSVHGLKKLWRGIYDRIEDVAPGFFGDAGGGDDEGKRGPEKRRQVLAYVRQRLEELRPWVPPAA